MPVLVGAPLFLLAACVSLATSWLLVSRLERVGERLGLSEALLGMVAALAADAPEITSAVTALLTHQQRVGAGVVIGSNVFNLAALLGLVVGIVVVTQTIYATTMDHLREYGTLKAIGAPNSYVYRVILQQAGMSAVLGYAMGITVSLFVVHGAQQGGAAILLPWPMALLIFGLTLLMCAVAAAGSINKVTHLDPAMVFPG